MKKSYLMIAVAALALTACSQNEELNYNEFKEVAMEFNIDGVEKTTRAELTTAWFGKSGNSFGVYGYKQANMVEQIFKNEAVVSKGSDLWEHETVRFWDKSVNTYNFYAYAPYTASGDVEFGSNGFTFKNLEIFSGDIASGDYDKAVACAIGIGYNNGTLCTEKKHSNAPTVPFIFKHVLSKLQFKVKTTDKASSVATFYLKEISAQFPKDATAQWAQTSATDASGEATYGTITTASLVKKTASGDLYASGDANLCTTLVHATKQASGDAITTSATQYGDTYIVVPVDNDKEKTHQFAVKVKYDILYKEDNTYEKDCIALGAVEYAPNSNDFYSIVINIDPAAIEFCVEGVDNWDEQSDGPTIDVD